MPNTGERREITRRVTAKEAETIQQSKKLVSKTKAALRKYGRDDFSAKRRHTGRAVSQMAGCGVTQVSSSNAEEPRETEDHRRDEEASSQMVNEGGPG
jgi:hypothetical protein